MVDVIIPMYMTKELVCRVVELVSKVRPIIQASPAPDKQMNKKKMPPKKRARRTGLSKSALPKRSKPVVPAVVKLKASVQITSTAMLQMLNRVMAKFDGWQHVGKWVETIWCEYRGQHNERCVSRLGDEHHPSENSIVQPVAPPVQIQTDVDYLEEVTISGVTCQKLQASKHLNASQKCVLPVRSTVEYSKEFKTDAWRFCIVKSWTHHTLKAALASMDTMDPEMRVDVELLQNKSYFSVHTDSYIAVSLLMKVACMFGEKCRMF